MTTSSKVNALVFGATGAVGGAAAAEGAKRGATITLAMRDPKKKLRDDISHLDRVQADLLDPASVVRAVKDTGANVAFVYVVMESDMSGIFDHLKSAGIQHVVLLSTYGILQYTDLEAALHGHMIAVAHARAEVALNKTGLAYSIVRPRFFASNLFWYADSLKQRKMVVPPVESCTDDFIVPEDIGAVCGACLFSETSEVLPLCGPQRILQGDVWRMIAKELGISDLSIEYAVDIPAWLASRGGAMPQPVLDALETVLRKGAEEGPELYYFEEGVANIEKLTGRKATPIAEWIKAHRAELASAAGL